MDIDSKESLRVRALLKEYGEVRSESRTFGILAIVCIILSVLTFITLIMAAFLFHQYILLFISLPLSIFFFLVSMAILVYNTNLGLRGNQIEEQLNKILDEPTIQWESTVGVFGGVGADFITSKLGKYWVKFSFLSIVASVGTVILCVTYAYQIFDDSLGIFVWYFLGFTIVLFAVAIFVSYKFYTRDWEKIKMSG